MTKGYMRSVQLSILAHFLWSVDVGIELKDVFTLNEEFFDRDLREIVALINDVTISEEKYYSLLNMKIENTYPELWLEISTQTIVGFKFAERLYDELRKDVAKRGIKGTT